MKIVSQTLVKTMNSKTKYKSLETTRLSHAIRMEPSRCMRLCSWLGESGWKPTYSLLNHGSSNTSNVFPLHSPPPLPHPRYWDSPWLWRNFILLNRCFALPRNFGLCLWRICFFRTLTLPTTFPFTRGGNLLGLFRSLFHSTLWSCLLEVLIAHHPRLP